MKTSYVLIHDNYTAPYTDDTDDKTTEVILIDEASYNNFMYIGFRNIIHIINGTYSSMKKSKLLNEQNKLKKIEKFVYLNIIVYTIMILYKLNK